MSLADTLDRMHRPIACKTGNIGTTPLSLQTFGFTAEEVGHTKRVFIYVHSVGLQVKWATDSPRGAPTGNHAIPGAEFPLMPAPTVGIGDGHGIPAGAEREIDGTEQALLLRMISATSGTAVTTITLEG